MASDHGNPVLKNATGGNPRKRAHLFISGLVQGVGYRAFTQREGIRRGLQGWVCNLANGQVEVEVEGEKEEIEAFIAVLNKGPFPSRIDSVDVQWMEAKREETSFFIKR